MKIYAYGLFFVLTFLLYLPAFSNTVAENFPDPTVIRGSDGYFYAYATGIEKTNFSVSRSKDLVKWEPAKEAMPVKPRWATTKKNFWAPHVLESKGLYYMFYSAEADSNRTEDFKLAVAIAKKPLGPFVDTGAPLDTGDAEVNIDPMVYQDELSGKVYLYWGRNGVIAVQELDQSLTKFAPDSTHKLLVHPGKKNYEKIVEGPFVMKQGRYYYMFYSGDDCCEDPHYAILAARSKHPLGPFVKLSSLPNESGIVLKGNDQWQNPGHNSVFKDLRGHWWLAFHAIDPRLVRSPSGNIHRVFKMSPLRFIDDWPISDIKEAVGEIP